VFGDVQYKLTDSFQVNAGLRYSKDRKKFDWVLADNFGTSIPYQETRSWDAVTGRFGVDWSLNDRVMLYAGYSRGFKSGGFNGVVLNPPLPAAEDISYDPEYADSFEGGVKSEWLDGRLVVNASLFHMILKNQQTLIVQPGNIFTVQNAAKSKVDGAELDIRLQATEALFMQASLGLLDARYSNFTENRTFPVPVNLDFSGNPLPAAPDITFSGLIEYRAPAWGGSYVTPRFEWSYTDDQNYDRYGKNRRDSLFGTLIPSAVDIQEAYWLLNASLAWDSADDKYSVTAWVRNLTDKGYYVKTIGNFADSFNGGGAVAYPGQPRMFGVTVRFNFE
jgi:iron complex outermembrane recepter protein